jgi:hypothetical protein
MRVARKNGEKREREGERERQRERENVRLKIKFSMEITARTKPTLHDRFFYIDVFFLLLFIFYMLHL